MAVPRDKEAAVAAPLKTFNAVELSIIIPILNEALMIGDALKMRCERIVSTSEPT